MSDEQPTDSRRRLYARGTPVRNLRLDDTIWDRVTSAAAARGETASDLMREALDRHLDDLEAGVL